MRKYILYYIFMLLYFPIFAQTSVSGRVVNSVSQAPLAGASVQLMGTQRMTRTDDNGDFILLVNADRVVLRITYLGFETLETSVSSGHPVVLKLNPVAGQLEEVVVSTGYQQLPKERATGSFVQLDQKQLNRRVSTDILSRLEDNTPGLVFNRDQYSEGPTDISIRGRSTISANAQPLIILNDFPFNGDINSINPNDVESITVLKDAAATSIWGARAGNGVIVITTKKGKVNTGPNITFNSNFTFGAKPDVFYNSRMSTADFIEVEKSLFTSGYYQSAENSPNKVPLSPVVELLIAQRDGKIDAAAVNKEIETLKTLDVRRDFKDNFYRSSLNQQYAVSILGGGERNEYYVSAGLDQNAPVLEGNHFKRMSLDATNTYHLLKNRLQFTSKINFTRLDNQISNDGINTIFSDSGTGLLYPYTRLIDENGQTLNMTHDYRTGFLADAVKSGLLDWSYNPIDEISNAQNNQTGTGYRLNAKLDYTFIPGLTGAVTYQYGRNENNAVNNHSMDTYYTRNLINLYTQQSATGALSYPIPLGGILDQRTAVSEDQNLRLQLSYQHSWKQIHALSFLGGWEIRSVNTIADSYRKYGYDSEHIISNKVDYLTSYPKYNNPASKSTIPFTDSGSSLSDRFRSWFSNASYSYHGKYIFSASARFDQSNLFGVSTNQKGVPLWSAGASWLLSEEPFYKIHGIPYLKLRMTYGRSGNIDKSLSAFTTAIYRDPRLSLIRQSYADLRNPPNPDLRWERNRMLNMGLDFETRGQVISGTVDYYSKRGDDLIGDTEYPPSSGITSFRGNTANTSGYGVDVSLNSLIIDRRFKWNTSLLNSYVKDKVTQYFLTASANNYVQRGGSGYPFVGNPLFAVYSYPQSGLDHLTGNPIGYIEGKESTDYNAILAAATPENIVYNGSSRPVMFGSLRNTFSYKSLSLSVTINYRAGYFFRRTSVNYGTVLSGNGGHGDYALRWKQPGDEAFTSVPSQPATVNTNRDNFYLFSNALVEKGDHVRMQDISLSYLIKPARNMKIKTLEIYTYINNLGLLWSATGSGLDPDYPYDSPPPLTFSSGIKINF